MACEDKTQYPNEQQAQRAAKRSAGRSGDVISAYRCEIHDCWHIGHPPLSRRLRK